MAGRGQGYRKSVFSGWACALLLATAWASFATPTQAQEGGFVTFTVGYDWIPNDVRALEDSGASIALYGGRMVSPQVELGAGIDLKRGPESIGCLTLGPCPTPNTTDLVELTLRVRRWIGGPPNGEGARVFLGARSGILFNQDSDRGLPLGGDLGVAIPVGGRIHFVTQGTAELVFLDEIGARTVIHAGLGIAL